MKENWKKFKAPVRLSFKKLPETHSKEPYVVKWNGIVPDIISVITLKQQYWGTHSVNTYQIPYRSYPFSVVTIIRPKGSARKHIKEGGTESLKGIKVFTHLSQNTCNTFLFYLITSLIQVITVREG